MHIHFESFSLFFAWKICLIFSIVSKAIADAKIDNTKKRDHGWEIMHHAGILFGLAFLVPYVYMTEMYFWPMMLRIAMMTGGAYMLLRAGIFNSVYNYMRGLDLEYLGSTDKWFDRPLLWLREKKRTLFGTKLPLPGLIAFYVFCFFLGVLI